MKSALTLASSVFSLFLAGCGSMQPSQFRLGGTVPIYGENQDVTLTGPVKIRMERSYWTDSFERPGATSVAPAFRDQYRVKPAAMFLVIDFTLVNTGSSPVGLPQTQPLMFTLRNARAVEYNSVGGDINFDDITSRTWMGRFSMNPNTPTAGKVVFDVPKDDYELLVSFGLFGTAGGFTLAKGPTLFKFALNPKNQ